MPTDKKFFANTIASISNLLNSIYSDYKNNIIDNDELAEALAERVELLKKGFSAEDDTALINKAMETTKSDPQIDIDDPLRDIGEFKILKKLQPAKHRKLEHTLSVVFEREFTGARRRHAHERDQHLRKESEQILSSYTFISPSVIFPEVKETVKHKRKILSIKKQKK